MQKYSENIVVGNGIMAKQLMFELKDHFSDITCISSLDFAPPCSLRTTAINCLRGTESGVSALGDLLVDAHKAFESFYDLYRPPGVEKTLEIQTWIENGEMHAKWLRRYKDYELKKTLTFSKVNLVKPLACVEVSAYIIDTNLFFKWYEEQLLAVNFVDDFIVCVIKNENSYRLTTKRGFTYTCKNLFFCTSYMTSQFIDLCLKDEHRVELKKHKKVYGNYLYYKLDPKIDYGFDLSKSFSFSYNYTRLIYRKDSEEFLFSFSDINKNSHSNSECIPLGIFEEFVNELNLKSLPQFSDWTFCKGIRIKGFRRLPFCEIVNSNLFITSGLYKNAFSFSFLFSNIIKKQLL